MTEHLNCETLKRNMKEGETYIIYLSTVTTEPFVFDLNANNCLYCSFI